MNGGTPASAEMKAAIEKACRADGKRPLTDYVGAKDPETVEYDLTFTYYIPNDAEASAADIENKVADAVNEYITWQSARMGRDINPSELIYRVKKTGIKRLEVESPVFAKLNYGKDGSIPQVAKLVNINITNGGYEDE